MNKQWRRVAATAMIGLLTGSAYAVVNPGTVAGYGTVIDSVAGKEWLRLDLTKQMSPTAALQYFGHLGFHVANRNEVVNLVNNSFSIPALAPSYQTFGWVVGNTLADSWIQSFGVTYAVSANQFSSVSGVYSYGFYDDTPTIVGQLGFVTQTDSQTQLTQSQFVNYGATQVPNQFSGVFLVKNLSLAPLAIPSPSTLPLTAASLFIMVAAMTNIRGRRPQPGATI